MQRQGRHMERSGSKRALDPGGSGGGGGGDDDEREPKRPRVPALARWVDTSWGWDWRFALA
jgi:hypothetical protein